MQDFQLGWTNGVFDMSTSRPKDDTIPLRDYLAILWRYRVLVVTVTLAITAVGALITTLLPPFYESESVIRLRSIGINATAPVFDASSMVGSITTPFFMEGAAQAAGITGSTRSLARGVHVGTMSDARMVWLRVRHTDPAVARALNAALVQAFIAQVASAVQPTRDEITARLREAEAQRVETEQILQQSRLLLREPARSGGGATDAVTRSFALTAMSTSGATLQRLAEERRDLEMQLLIYALPALVTGPTMPVVPSGPPRARNIILAGLLGAAVAAAAAFAVEYVRPSRAPVALGPEAATISRHERQTE